MKLDDIREQWPFLELMHPAHLAYIKRMPYNTLDYFLRVIYELEPQKRHEILQVGTYFLFSDSMEKEERLRLLHDGERLFEEFGMKCLEASKVFHEVLLINSVVRYMLYELSRLGNKTNVDTIKDNLVGFADHLLKKDASLPGTDEFVDKLVEQATNMEERTEQYYSLYTYFCENVLVRLAEQEKAWDQQLNKQSSENPEDE